jgi:hypothetical protein
MCRHNGTNDVLQVSGRALQVANKQGLHSHLTRSFTSTALLPADRVCTWQQHTCTTHPQATPPPDPRCAMCSPGRAAAARVLAVLLTLLLAPLGGLLVPAACST